MIDLFQPQVGAEELAAVHEVFASSWLGRGDKVTEFERAFGARIGMPANELHAVTSCTDGLFHAIAALGIGDGDDVLLPTISFVGAAHAVRATGARVILCDVECVGLNPTVEDIERAATPATKAIIVLHFGGSPGAIAEIAAWARSRSMTLIEDAAVSLGSSVNGRACGTLGDIGVWSFDAMKAITTGDGGMVWCQDPETLETIRRSSSLGLGPSGFGQRYDSSRWWEIDPVSLGRRGAMHSIAAAIGLAQLTKLDGFLGRRREIAALYDARLGSLPWMSPPSPPAAEEAKSFYWVQCPANARDHLAAHLLKRGIYTSFKYWPLHCTRMYGGGGRFPGADAAAASTLLLPFHSGLTDRDAHEVVTAVREFAPDAAGVQ